MTDKLLLSVCDVHQTCTQKTYFVAFDDGTFDFHTDQVPVAERLQRFAEDVFGPTYCVGIEHMEGEMVISREH